MKTKEKLNKGITLVALVVTIIILLILAGVGIQALTQTGLFEKAKQARQKSENAEIEEKTILGDYENKIDSIEGSRDSKKEDNRYLDKKWSMYFEKNLNYQYSVQEDGYYLVGIMCANTLKTVPSIKTNR